MFSIFIALYYVLVIVLVTFVSHIHCSLVSHSPNILQIHIDFLPALKFNQKIYYGRKLITNNEETSTTSSAYPGPINDLLKTSQASDNAISLLRGLILLRVGRIDESHELIQNLPTTPAVAYAHSLIHRYEGQNIGDNYLTGFSNSGYWLDDIGDFATFKELLVHISRMEGKNANSNIERFIRDCTKSGKWKPTKFLNFCIESTRSQVKFNERNKIICIEVISCP